MNTIPAEIMKALHAAQTQATTVEKASYNDFSKYAYTSAEEMVRAGKPALINNGLGLATTAWELRELNSGGMYVHVTYELFHHESGKGFVSTSDTPVVPEKGRPLDKAVSTALTYNLGYFIRGLLLMARVEEGTDVDQRDDRNYTPPAPALAKSVKAVSGPKSAAAAESSLYWINKFRDCPTLAAFQELTNTFRSTVPEQSPIRAEVSPIWAEVRNVLKAKEA